VPDESKAEHIQAEHPPEADTATVTRGLVRWPEEGTRPNKIFKLGALVICLKVVKKTGFGIWDLGFGI